MQQWYETELLNHKKPSLTTLKGYDANKRFVAEEQPIGLNIEEARGNL